MPAKKPLGLHDSAKTKADHDARAAAEASMRPKLGLPASAPARLKKHPDAAAVWRRLLRVYDELDAEIVTRLDLDLLIDYCILMEQVEQLDKMRQAAYKAWLQLADKHQALEADGEEEAALVYAAQVVDAFNAVVKLDARADQKRKTLHQWRQSLYLTPRSRAGVAPATKEDEAPPDDLELLLNDVTNYVNGGE